MDQHLLKKECIAPMNSMKYGKVGYWLKKVFRGRQSAAGHVDLPAGRTFPTGVLMKICGHDKMDLPAECFLCKSLKSFPFKVVLIQPQFFILRLQFNKRFLTSILLNAL